MKTIQEYRLDSLNIAPQTLYLPKDAEVVGVYGCVDGINLIVVITPNNIETTLRTFKICATLETLYIDSFKYIGSLRDDFGAQHIIEII